MEVKSYHHGDLRAALIRSGMTLLAAEDVEDLSLRKVARSVGVSATAVYRHFPDKQALMSALAAEGLRMLATVQRAASESAGGGRAGFDATGRAYVHFALENPALFRLIFSRFTHESLRGTSEPGGSDAMAFLRANAAEAAAGRGDAEVTAVQAWSLAHGLAMLILDDQVGSDPILVEKVFSDWM